jgi:hypothetical protein
MFLHVGDVTCYVTYVHACRHMISTRHHVGADKGWMDHISETKKAAMETSV